MTVSPVTGMNNSNEIQAEWNERDYDVHWWGSSRECLVDGYESGRLY